MRKLYWILLLFPLSLFAQEHFYYYKGDKKYLQLDTNYLFVSTINKSVLQEDSIFKGYCFLTIHKERFSELLKHKQNISSDLYWTEIKLSEKNEKTV